VKDRLIISVCPTEWRMARDRKACINKFFISIDFVISNREPTHDDVRRY
jgi:hypothetical protein